MDVKLPDGTVIADIPEGTSKQQLVDKLSRNGYDTRKLGLTSEAQAFRPADALTAAPSGMEQFIGGAKHAWDKGAQGLKELLPEPVQKAGDWLEQKLTGNPTDLPELNRQGAAFVRETGPASTVGEIGGQVALTAAPAARVFKAVAGANPALWRGLAAGASAGAAPAAVLTPGDLAERGEAAAYDAAGGVLGEAGGRVLKRALEGRLVTPSKHAETLMARGVQPTVGQGAAGEGFRAVEDFAAGMPVVGGLVRSGQRRAMREGVNDVFSEGIPIHNVPDELLSKLHEAGTDTRKRLKALGDISRWSYEDVVSKTPHIEVDSDLIRHTAQLRDSVAPTARREVEAILAPYMQNGRTLTGQDMHIITKDLGDLAQDFLTSERAMDKRAGRSLQLVQQELKEAFFGNSLKEVDDAFANLVRLRKAGSYVGTVDDVTPAHLERAVKGESGTTQYAEGQARMQDYSDPVSILRVSSRSPMQMAASTGAGAVAGLTGMHIPAIIAQALATAGTNPTFARAMFGNSNTQQAMAKMLRNSPAAPAVAGSALAEQRRRKATETGPRKPLNQY